MTDELNATRPDGPVHWLVGYGFGNGVWFEKEAAAVDAAKALAVGGYKTTVYRSVVDFEPVAVEPKCTCKTEPGGRAFCGIHGEPRYRTVSSPRVAAKDAPQQPERPPGEQVGSGTRHLTSK